MIFGYALFGLAQTGAPPSDTTGAALRYLLRRRHADGHWESHEKRRPPFEASDFTATALAARVIAGYAARDRCGDGGHALNAAGSHRAGGKRDQVRPPPQVLPVRTRACASVPTFRRARRRRILRACGGKSRS
jgi:hypothetical protein